MSEELRKLRLHFSERFQNIERRTHHPSSSGLRLDMRMAQQHHEKCLRREMELNMMRLRDEMLSQMPNKPSLDSIRANFEGKGDTRIYGWFKLVSSLTSHIIFIQISTEASHTQAFWAYMSRTAATSLLTQVLTTPILFICHKIYNLESLEHLKRRVDYLELSNTFQKQNNVPRQILPEPDDELLSAKLWLLNRSKQINKE